MSTSPAATVLATALDPLCFPLWGSRLIEASAGTGKTWTIAALYLRLVLGHGVPAGEGGAGDATGFGRPLAPAEILVMTFTRAATRELSDRIRSRLIEAARVFRGEQPAALGDALLSGLMAAYPEGEARSAAAWRLAVAAEGMDDAAVHTIDAWCQRMLREHAFDSGCLFDEELAANELAMQTEATRDYWRQQVYPLTPEALDAVLTVWKGVDALARDARQLLEQDLPDAGGQGSLAERLAALQAERAAALQALKAGWADQAEAMRTWLDAQVTRADCPFKKTSVHPRYYTAWLDALVAWATDPLRDEPALSTSATHRLVPAGLREVLKPGATVELPGHFAAFEQLLADLAQLAPLSAGLRLHAAVRIRARLAELKQQAGSFGFADMLNRLDQALDPQHNGEAAERLRQRMLAQYPVALIDEFQDTSPLQSRIFDRLYRIADNRPDTALLLIGDPKQSIYGFRGADIYSYLQARGATTGRHYMLGTNHRSTEALVAAVNQLFAQAEQRQGEGAFMFRGEDGDNPLPFLPVQARGRREHFVSSAGAEPAISLVLDTQLRNGDAHRRSYAARCAEQIVQLLNDAAAGFDGPGGLVRLRPADIAVLVRTSKEAAAVRRELRRRAVASVYLSDKDSVFASGEARDLLHWLRAVASPRDVRLARAALATRTVGLPLAELLHLASNDEAFDARSEQLRQLHALWLGQGVLSMLRQTLHLLDLPARWLRPPAPTADTADTDAALNEAATDGERRLTNVLHLAELLQTASTQLDGEQALIRWLASQIEGEGGAGDEQIVRLESDADLVKVVTVHKSKGLEYPLVFLPFPCSFRPKDRAGTGFVNQPDARGLRQLNLAPTPAQIALEDRERLREDLRLLYVALTRARHALWVGLAALKLGAAKACTWQRSAIGLLLSGPQQADPATLAQQVADAVAPCPQTRLQMAAPGAVPVTRLQRSEVAAPLRPLSPYEARFERRWAIGSFTALVRDLPAQGLWAASTAAVRNDELPADAEASAAASAGEQPFAFQPVGAPDPAALAAASLQAWHHFPRGAVPGNFLHDQLEWLASEGFGLAGSDELQQQLRQRCERQGWGPRAEAVLSWLLRVTTTVLPPLGAALQALDRPLPEMEFWLPSEALSSAAVDALCRQHLLPGLPRPPLPERELRGMLMGFADLVFEHGGRYWVLDYKSNHLGMHDADYSPDALATAMAEHRYDVQAAVYLAALHRLLRSRLGEAYDPAKHLGGAVYLFLRGIDGPAGGCVWVPPALPLLQGMDTLLGESVEAAP